MSYEPDWNEPGFYIDAEEDEVRCFRCSDPLDPDDTVWANIEGQIVKEGNDTAWCVACLPNEGESNE